MISGRITVSGTQLQQSIFRCNAVDDGGGPRETLYVEVRASAEVLPHAEELPAEVGCREEQDLN
jgi:hypothetical protein